MSDDEAHLYAELLEIGDSNRVQMDRADKLLQFAVQRKMHVEFRSKLAGLRNKLEGVRKQVTFAAEGVATATVTG